MKFDLSEDELKFLQAVESRISGLLSSFETDLLCASKILTEVSSHLSLAKSSKKARPLLTYYFGSALNVDTAALVDAATASELLHCASLLHDDVVDNAHTRRGNPSANAKWNNGTAVLSGNYLLCLAFDLLTPYPISLTRDGVRVVKQMTKAAMAEILIRENPLITLKEWKEIAEGKTGALFGLCGLAGARIKNNDDAALRFVKCANHIGTVFQMTDDVIDITDDSGLKDRYSDILNKELSFPLVLATSDPRIHQSISRAWSEETVSLDTAADIGRQITLCGALEQAKHMISQEISAAIDSLGHYAETKGGKRVTDWLLALGARV